MRLSVWLLVLLCCSLCSEGQAFFEERYNDCGDHNPCKDCGDAVFRAGNMTNYFKTKMKQSQHRYPKLNGKILCWVNIDTSGKSCMLGIKDATINKQIRHDIRQWIQEVKWTAPSVTGKPNKTTALLRFIFNNTLLRVDRLSPDDTDVDFVIDPKIDIKSPEYTYVEQMPRPSFNMQEYLAKTIHYPDSAMASGIGGRVVVKFVVNEDGHTSDATIFKSVGYGCDEEAIRAILAMPKWIPGKQQGKPIKVYFTQPITFQLSDPKDAVLEDEDDVPASH